MNSYFQRTNPRHAKQLPPVRLKEAKCELDRKILADIAAQDPAGFAQIIEIAKGALKAKPTATLPKA